MRSRKKEIESVVGLLTQAHPDVYALAEIVWKEIDQQRRQRDGWVIIVDHGSNVILTYGMYDTEAAALKDLQKFRSTTGNERARVTKLISASEIFGFTQASDLR